MATLGEKNSPKSVATPIPLLPRFIHDDIALRAVLKVGESGQLLVLVGEQREVDRDPIVEPIEDAEHALRIVCAVGDAVATVREVPRQGELGAIGGENPVALP